VYVLVQRDGKTLFLRRANTGYANGKYTLPAGHMDGGEAPSAAAARELQEEVGLTADAKDLELLHAMVYRAAEGDHERLSLFFRATAFTGEPRNMEPAKCDDLQWFNDDELPGEMVWELRHALDQIKDGKHYSEANY